MRRASSPRGQSLVEFALVLPILALLLSGGADLARAYFVGIQIADGARQAGLYASDHPPVLAGSGPSTVPGSGYTTPDLQAIATSNAGGASGLIGCPSTDITVKVGATSTDSNTGPGYYQPVSVSCSLPLITPFLPSPVTIGSTVEALVIPTS
ncbi:MAG: TadE/TadG family type IV pilus assembly protein [Candidatus Dormibacteria bacterium]